MTAKFNEPGMERTGWRKLPDGKWVPIPDGETPRGKVKLKVSELDMSLEASHARMQRTLAMESARLEAAATKGVLGMLDTEVLGKLSTIWRTLVQNEPTKDYGDLTDEELKAKLAEVKKR